MGNIGAHSPSVVELLLQFGADPNSGSSKTANQQQSKACDSSEEEEELYTLSQYRVPVAGRNEGGNKPTPLHMLCAVAIPKHSEGKKVVRG